MSLTPNEAASALRDIEETGRRSGQAFGYRQAAPHFIIWGLVWVFGYAGTDFFPRQAGEIWLAGIVLGALAATLVSRFGAMGGRAVNGAWRTFGVVVIVALFIMGTYAIMWPVMPRQQAAFVPLLAASAYSAIGLWAGLRWIAAGVAIAALTLGGFFYVQEHFALWMAVVGGGGLVLAGLWMRSA
jgi:hypothetical protein